MATDEFGEIAREDTLSPGTVVAGRYVIVRQVGTGGMGSVYLAEDHLLQGETVAIKILHTGHLHDQNQVARFLREVQLMRRVNHPNVVRTFDVGNDGSYIYFTMEFVDGVQLDRLLGPLGLEQQKIVPYILQLCAALDAIHTAGIIHRDLKPGNVLVEPGDRLRLTDFGVARPEVSELTKHNEIIGSVCYMAPEIWLGKKITSSIDLYSLGVICYELTTGKVPFDAGTPALLMRLHLDGAVVPPKNHNDAVPLWLNKLIVRLLAKTAEERPRDAREVSEYVRRHADGPGEASGVMPSIKSGDAAQQFFSTLEEQNRRRSLTNLPQFKPDDATSAPTAAPLSSLENSSANISVVRRSVVQGKQRSARSASLSGRQSFGPRRLSGALMLLVTALAAAAVAGMAPPPQHIGGFRGSEVLETIEKMRGVPLSAIAGSYAHEAVLKTLIWSLPVMVAAVMCGAGALRTLASYLYLVAIRILAIAALATYHLVPNIGLDRVNSVTVSSALDRAASHLDASLLFAPFSIVYEQVRVPDGIVYSSVAVSGLLGDYAAVVLYLVVVLAAVYLGWARQLGMRFTTSLIVSLAMLAVAIGEGMLSPAVQSETLLRETVAAVELPPPMLPIGVANMVALFIVLPFIARTIKNRGS